VECKKGDLESPRIQEIIVAFVNHRVQAPCPDSVHCKKHGDLNDQRTGLATKQARQREMLT
jgi:hypothetical protein